MTMDSEPASGRLGLFSSSLSSSSGARSGGAFRPLLGVVIETLRVAIDLVLPRTCPGCHAPVPWCEACAATLQRRPRAVALPEAALDRLAAAGLVLPTVHALARYAGPVRAAIIAGKERGRRGSWRCRTRRCYRRSCGSFRRRPGVHRRGHAVVTRSPPWLGWPRRCSPRTGGRRASPRAFACPGKSVIRSASTLPRAPRTSPAPSSSMRGRRPRRARSPFCSTTCSPPVRPSVDHARRWLRAASHSAVCWFSPRFRRRESRCSRHPRAAVRSGHDRRPARGACTRRPVMHGRFIRSTGVRTGHATPVRDWDQHGS